LRVADHFPSRITFYSFLFLSDKDLYYHLQKLNHIFRLSQIPTHSITVITDGGVKKFNIALAVAHIWINDSIANQLQLQFMNVTSVKAKLMAIHIGLISAIEHNDTHDIIIITDSIAATSKILESKVNPFQNIVIPLATKIKFFLNKDTRNAIHFWYCPSKAKWPRHKLVDNQVKTNNIPPMCPTSNSYLFNKKKEYDDILKE